MIKGKYDLALKCRERRQSQKEEILGTLYYYGENALLVVVLTIEFLLILGFAG